MLRVIGRSLHPCARAVRGSCSICNTGSCRPTAIYRSHTQNSLRLQLCCRSMAHAEAPAHTNRLAQEQSPYLLQHAHNPVDWYPWSTDAFERAREENKPIFLSVGYSTCHWCHVMERESFESESVAAVLNAGFISIKVDREERPDVDKVYMTYVQATQGGGGWPMNVFLTPKLQPFFGGTYFPPRDMPGRPSFVSLLQRIRQVWEQQQEELLDSSADTMRQLTEAMASTGSPEPGAASSSKPLAETAVAACSAALAERFDAQRGGFGSAPKFPRPCELNLLLVYHLTATQAGNAQLAEQALHMATFSLLKMAAGGMYDQMGGGFHRYSVDPELHIPHFEKMLYDNPQLAATYLDAYACTQDPELAATARGILDYLLRDMQHTSGAFFSAEDADSTNPEGAKTEGAFYLWTCAEVDAVLGDGAALFKDFYYIKPEGNADLSRMSDPHGEFGGLNCLVRRKSLQAAAAAAGLSPAEAESKLAAAREKLHAVRAKRPRPHLDDKVVAGWNGMAIGALAKASAVLQSEDPPAPRSFPVEGCQPSMYLDASIKAATSIQERLWDADRQRLMRSFRTDTSLVEAFADDYAYLIAGLLDLHAVCGDVRWLRWALELQATLDSLFWDPAAGGYFGTAGNDPSILLRMKEDYDGAEPAATSVAACNLARLSALLEHGSGSFCHRAQQAVASVSGRLAEIPLALPQMCCALPALAGSHPQVVIVGSRADSGTQRLLAAAHSAFLPYKAVILLDTADQACMDFWREHNPAVAEMERDKPKGATAFVCQNFSCQAPTTDPMTVSKQLQNYRQPKASVKAQPMSLSELAT